MNKFFCRISNLCKNKKGDLIVIALFVVLCFLLNLFSLELPVRVHNDGYKCKGVITAIDNSQIVSHALVSAGEQLVKVKLLNGPRAGEEVDAVNMLRSNLDLDKVFAVGDIAWVGVLEKGDGTIQHVNAQDHYRLEDAAWLFGIFALFLLIFGGLTGVKALLSVVFSCQVIWQLTIPLCLKGWSPIWVCFGAVALLSAVIIFAVNGFRGKGVTAFSGTMLGVGASCLMAIAFTHLFRINGAVMPYSQALYYSGYEFLNLTDLFIGAIFLASSGAVMDLATDVAAGMQEVVRENPEISTIRLMASGFRIGRLVVGTMTTTLLLAYSGGYLTVMMSFAAEGVAMSDFLNFPYVAAEVVKTLIGSLGLVLVAPFTALCGGVLLKKHGEHIVKTVSKERI